MNSRKTMARAAAAALSLALLPGVAGAQQRDPVEVRLVADVADPVAAGGGHLGVLIRPQPGWAVLWRHPGNGEPAPRVRFEVGPGLIAGAAVWPVPHVLEGRDGSVRYGYRGSVVVAAPVIPMEPVRAGTSIRTGAVVRWTACKVSCRSGEVRLAGEFPVSAAEVKSAAGFFERWMEELPPPEDDPGAALPFAVQWSGGLGGGQRWGAMTLWLRWPRDPGRVEWIPEPDRGMHVERPKVSHRGRLTRIDFTVELGGDQETPRLDSLVVANSPRGREAYRLMLPVTAATGSRPRSSR